MEVHWDDFEPSPAERAGVDEWIAANDSPDIGYIAINAQAVFVHGNREHISQSAVRDHHSDIGGALTHALAELRQNL